MVENTFLRKRSITLNITVMSDGTPDIYLQWTMNINTTSELIYYAELNLI